MEDLGMRFARILANFCLKDGVYPTPIPGTDYVKFSQTDRHIKWHWPASLIIIAQGCKEIILGNQLYQCGKAHYIAVPIDLPVMSRIYTASPEKPYLSLRIDFNLLTFTEVAAEMEKDFPDEKENPSHAIFFGSANDKMISAAIRLVELFQTPQDAFVLGPWVIKEMFYYLLKDVHGLAIRKFVRAGSKMYKISQAIHSLKSALCDDIDIHALANAANMSRSVFFKHFKAVTAMSPIQYQKYLRLHEAKRLMLEEGKNAESSAFKVGYKSTSQFSREYSRMFGNSPLRDTMTIKKLTQD